MIHKLLNRIAAYIKERNSDQILTLLSFGLLTGWVISFPYEGPVFYGFIAKSVKDLHFINTYNLFFLALGLLGGVFVRQKNESIKKIIQTLVAGCLLLSLIFPFVPVEIWAFILPFVSLVSGVAMTLHGHQVKNHFPRKMWQSVAPDTMIIACLVVIMVHIIVNNISVFVGWVFIEIVLAAALVAITRVASRGKCIGKSPSTDPVHIAGRFWLLFIFIFVITINAGILFQAILPSFAHYETLVSLYTNLPYLAAVIFCSKIYRRNKFNLLFVGLSLWGLALLLYSNLAVSPFTFLLIIGCILFACGIFDFFWWTIMTTSFSYVRNPASMFGAILFINVLGSWAGGLSTNFLIQRELPGEHIITLGFGVIMLCMVLLVPLNEKLSSLLVDNEFLQSLNWNQNINVEEVVLRKLSARELEVFDLLVSGMRDKDISTTLNISLNTVKTHNSKIYHKLQIKNRAELRRNYGGILKHPN